MCRDEVARVLWLVMTLESRANGSTKHTHSTYILFSHLHTFALQFEPILGGQTQPKSINSTGESLQRALAA